jgi:hypothetical protein
MDRETLKSKLQEILSKGSEGEIPRRAPDTDSASHYEHADTGEGMTGAEGRPIEPEGARVSGIARLKWVFFVLALLYVLVSAYHGLILTSMGRYLVPHARFARARREHRVRLSSVSQINSLLLLCVLCVLCVSHSCCPLVPSSLNAER